ncbi:hypothetical protein D3C86_1083630 [compost metagenome]
MSHQAGAARQDRYAAQGLERETGTKEHGRYGRRDIQLQFPAEDLRNDTLDGLGNVHVGQVRTGLLGGEKQCRNSRIAFLVQRMAITRQWTLGCPVFRYDNMRRRDHRFALIDSLLDLIKQNTGIRRRSEYHGAAPQQTGGDCALHGFRRSCQRHARRLYAGNQTVFSDGHQCGVEHR